MNLINLNIMVGGLVFLQAYYLFSYKGLEVSTLIRWSVDVSDSNERLGFLKIKLKSLMKIIETLWGNIDFLLNKNISVLHKNTTLN